MQILGIDIGGTGIKGAIVDTSTGELLTEKFRLKTPKPAKPEEVAKTVQGLKEKFTELSRKVNSHIRTVKKRLNQLDEIEDEE